MERTTTHPDCGSGDYEYRGHLDRLNCKTATQPLKPESNETNIQWQDYWCHRDSSPSGWLRESSKPANAPNRTIPMDSDKSFAVAVCAKFFRQSMTKRAMISSTSLDLPEHRRQVIEACQRIDFFPHGGRIFGFFGFRWGRYR